MFILDSAVQSEEQKKILPRPAYVFSPEELKCLWDFIQWQHLPYDKHELKTLIRQIGDIVDNKRATYKGHPMHICEKAPMNEIFLVPVGTKICPYCGEKIA